MKMVATIARYLLGVGLLIFGANAFLSFMPAPEYPGEAGQFLGLLYTAGYFSIIGILKIVSGLMLVIGRFVPLGLVLIGPVLVNILIFHFVFDPASIGAGAVFSVLWFLVFFQYKESFSGIFESQPS